MLKTAVSESIRIVGFPIQPDYICYVIAFKIRKIIFRSVFLRVSCKNIKKIYRLQYFSTTNKQNFQGIKMKNKNIPLNVTIHYIQLNTPALHVILTNKF